MGKKQKIALREQNRAQRSREHAKPFEIQSHPGKI